MNRHFALLAAIAALTVPTTAPAEGEAVGGFPNWAERVIHQWTNRARCDPQVEMTACGAACGEAACYAPMAPLAWSDAAGRAARFHADEMRLQAYQSHDSQCTVPADIASRYPATCDGSATCACVGGASACSPTCTSFSARLGLFGAAAFGENIVGGGDPDVAFSMWLRESSTSTTCGPSATNVHRWLILASTGSMGAGVSGYAVVDFTGSGTPPKVPSGSHYPKQAASVEAWASWYDASGPAAAVVAVDGSCTAMTLGRGTPTNGAWRALLAGLETGCHRYYFAFRDAGGALVTYPTTGSLGIGGVGCADWSTERPSLGAGCSAVAACDATAPGACDDGNPCTVDACDTITGCGHTPASTATTCSDGQACNGVEHCDGAGACAAGSTCQEPAPAPTPTSGCGCGGTAGGGGLVLALLGLGIGTPRRRSGRRPIGAGTGC